MRINIKVIQVRKYAYSFIFPGILFRLFLINSFCFLQILKKNHVHTLADVGLLRADVKSAILTAVVIVFCWSFHFFSFVYFSMLCLVLCCFFSDLNVKLIKKNEKLTVFCSCTPLIWGELKIFWVIRYFLKLEKSHLALMLI